MSAAAEQSRRKANMVARGDGTGNSALEAEPRIPPNKYIDIVHQSYKWDRRHPPLLMVCGVSYQLS